MLVRRHRASVFRFARALSANAPEAEEILQRTFIDAWRGAGSFAGVGTARSWLFAIARRSAQRLHRRRVGEPREHEELDVLGCEAGWGADGQRVAAAIEDREWVVRALEALSIADRELLVLVDVEGHSVAEAASILEVTVAATKSRLHRARLRMLASLRNEVDDEG